MQSLRIATLVAASLVLSATAARTQSPPGRVHRWSVSYGIGTTSAPRAERDFNAALAAAGFDQWSSTEKLECFFIACWTRTVEGPSDSHSSGRSRSLSIGYTFDSGLELRAGGTAATTGWAYGARVGFDGAFFEHEVANLNTMALAKIGILRLGVGPELTRVSMDARSFSDAEWTAREWHQVLAQEYRSTGETRSARSTQLGAVTSASVAIGGRVYAEIGLEYHFTPSFTTPALNVNGIYAGSSARIPASRVSFNRRVLLFSLGLRQ